MAEAEAEDKDKGCRHDPHASLIGVDYWGKVDPRLTKEHMYALAGACQPQSASPVGAAKLGNKAAQLTKVHALRVVPASKVEKPGQQARLGEANQPRQIAAKQGGIC
ncbi:hypothetical protein FRC07_010970 [Ceratobasidium sp. 392]|nr:hypothetical protein FRC07_010970 [Ceratobasidium sp. 392]